MFVLPNLACESIDKLLKNFLWANSRSVVGMVSIKWKNTCLPKSQGGLGLRSLHEWNIALMAKHLWNIVCDKDSIWVRWIKAHKLKGANLWDIECKKSYSWCWKQILNLRDKIRNFVSVEIGNGKCCNIWFDKWHDKGPLSRLISHRIIEQAGFSLSAKVYHMITNGNWIWPSQWVVDYGEVVNVPVPNLSDNIEDRIVWHSKKVKVKKFSASEAWKAIRS
jgi:hypothetical protein